MWERRGVAYRRHNWAVFAAHCRLKAIGNGDEHRTLWSQSCDKAMLTMGTFTFLPFIREVNLHQSTMLNLVKSQISRPNYFWQPNICWTAKFCEDTLNHGQAITTGRFYVLWLELKSLTLTSQKLMVKFGTDAKYFPENQTCSFGEMTTSIMNQRTNQQTYVITIPPDR